MTEASATRVAVTSTLDYYLLDPDCPRGLLVEEFELADDLSATRLRTAGWTPAHGGWWSSAAFARAVRTDPDVRARVRAVSRTEAAETYRRLGGGALPDDDALRDRFGDDVSLAGAAPLRLDVGPPVHRVLFAGGLDTARLGQLRAALRLDGTTEHGAGRLRVDGTALRWELRHAGGVAWCLDVTAEPLDRDALRPLLRRLTGVVRGHGLVPATVECLG
ncbi:hypothetical protein [Micromonospora sp. WMMD980]|uniref:hypothetical protein n=1 Tax=Micromonospora sp. WMMD980 TaxID=3016088 RepID=UPI0024171885|nr:hypothetical protein [Micromonospora sp. WMMD980]MDG4801314.1 hypothetical protein [Micromonospora sp. WMMD980]